MNEFEVYDDERDFTEEEQCPYCTGSAWPIGSLGRTEWYRCEDCGLEFSI